VLCVVFMRRASSAWLSPARLRAFATSSISANSSSSASYAAYLGVFQKPRLQVLVLRHLTSSTRANTTITEKR
jgi:hypothetical protein